MSATLSRRRLIQATAWTAPAVVLASAAPAYATSGATTPRICTPTPYELAWSSASWQTVGAGAAASSGVGAARALNDRAINPNIAVQVTRRFSGQMQAHGDAATGDNMQISPTHVGGTQSRGLTLYQRYRANAQGVGATASQTLDFHFGQEVRELAFTIHDIDGTANQFHDRVTVSLAPQTVTHASERRWVGGWLSGGYQNVPTTEGAGTPASPLTSVARTAVNNASGSLGSVRVAFKPDQKIQSFSLTFFNGVTGSLNLQGQQAIYLSNFSFTADICR